MVLSSEKYDQDYWYYYADSEKYLRQWGDRHQLKCYKIKQWTIFGKRTENEAKENKKMNIDNTAQADDLIYVEDVIEMFGGKIPKTWFTPGSGRKSFRL